MVNNLKLYYVDMKYIRDLHNADNNVMSVSPQTGKDTRPFIGIILILNSKKYCIPLTSGNKEKFSHKNNALDFIKIPDLGKKNENGAFVTLGGLNINNMIPVDDTLISPLQLKINSNDPLQLQREKNRLTKELDWCQKNKDLIIKRANSVYTLRTNYPDKNRNLTRRCCDFKKLEEVMYRYLGKGKTHEIPTVRLPKKKPPMPDPPKSRGRR